MSSSPALYVVIRQGQILALVEDIATKQAVGVAQIDVSDVSRPSYCFCRHAGS